MKFLLIPLIFLSGVAMPVEDALNARLKEALQSPAASTLVSFIVGGLVIALVTATGVMGRGTVSHLSGSPWWMWLGGALGVFIVIMAILGLPKIGATVLMAVTIFGQLAMSLTMDNFGWLGVPKISLNAWRIAGVVLIFVGVLMTNKK